MLLTQKPRLAAFLLALIAPSVFALGSATAGGSSSVSAASPGGAAALSEATASEIVGAAAYAQIRAAGKAVRSGSDARLELLPKHSAASGVAESVAADKSGVVVEAVFALQRKRPDAAAARRSELASIYGLMRSFSTLKGIEYYSVTYGKMRTLYSESYRIDDAAKRSPLPDQSPPSPDALPSKESILVFQKDTSFGANVYRYSFTSFPDALLVEATNLTKMSYGIVPMVAAEGLKTRLIAVCAADAIVFYVESDTEAPGLLRSRVGDSFANRAAALFAWFSANASFLKP
jgi:hypothetical protein